MEGDTITGKEAEEIHQFIRDWISRNVGEEISKGVRIQYGGHVSSDECYSFIVEPNIDGFLIANDD